MGYYFKHYTGIAGACLMMIGLCYSPVLMSLGVLLIFIQPFIDFSIPELLKQARSRSLFWIGAGYFFIHFIALFYAENIPEFFNHQKIILPLLLVPFGLLSPAFYKKNNQFLILGVFLLTVFSTGVLSFGNYLLHFEKINEKIAHSKTVPIVTGVNHIYYSIILAFSIVIGGVALWKKWFKRREVKIALLLITLANFVFLHVFTARTGLGGFYVALGMIILVNFVKNKKYGLAAGSIAGLICLGVLAISFVPSLHQKYENTLKDINVYWEDKNPNYYSITMRLEAWETTCHVIMNNPLLGVAPGDLVDELDHAYEEMGTLLLEKNRMGPHNQFLENMAQIGILGLLFTLALFIWPLKYLFKKHSDLGLGLFMIILFACMFESILERQTGVTFFSFFWFWIFYPLEKEKRGN